LYRRGCGQGLVKVSTRPVPLLDMGENNVQVADVMTACCEWSTAAIHASRVVVSMAP
jgi:hypothetical protein